MSRWWERTSREHRPRTLAEKVWDAHVVRSAAGEPDLLYIDLHLVHEVTSPQAFDGLRAAGRPVRRPDLTLATEDHNTPTDNLVPILDPISRTQIETLRRNCDEFGIQLHSLGDAEQGIVHVIGPQLGLTQPGLTIVCGDSHTSTHGAFGALAFGIGTSEVEHVLATQTLPQSRPKTMAVNVIGELRPGVTAKDLVLALITQVGTGGGRGHVVEYRGAAIRGLSMEGRMTISNMSIEWGAKAGMIAPDETTFAYVKGRAARAEGRRLGRRGGLLADPAHRRRTRPSTPRSPSTPARSRPFVTWGTNPGQGVALDAVVPGPDDFADAGRARPPPRGPWPTWTCAPAPGCGTCRSTWCSSARAPTAGWRTCGPPPRSSGATRSPTAYACWSCPDRPRYAPRPRPRGWTRCSPTPVPSGGSPAARCAWA